MVLFKQGRSEEASALLRRAIDIMDAAGVPESHPDRSVYAENLSEVLEAVQEEDDSADPTRAVSI